MKKYIIAQSGTHGTRKSSNAAEEFEKFKKSGSHLSSRILTDVEYDAPYPINKEMTREGQMWMFGSRISLDLAMLAKADVLFTDRTIVDVIAYTHVIGFHDLAQDMLCYAEQHIHLYKTIYFRKIETNDFCCKDGIRETSDVAFRQAVQETLEFLYDVLASGGSYQGEVIHV